VRCRLHITKIAISCKYNWVPPISKKTHSLENKINWVWDHNVIKIWGIGFDWRIKIVLVVFWTTCREQPWAYPNSVSNIICTRLLYFYRFHDTILASLLSLVSILYKLTVVLNTVLMCIIVNYTYVVLNLNFTLLHKFLLVMFWQLHKLYSVEFTHVEMCFNILKYHDKYHKKIQSNISILFLVYNLVTWKLLANPLNCWHWF
jgi:hypothetical protein